MSEVDTEAARVALCNDLIAAREAIGREYEEAVALLHPSDVAGTYSAFADHDKKLKAIYDDYREKRDALPADYAVQWAARGRDPGLRDALGARAVAMQNGAEDH